MTYILLFLVFFKVGLLGFGGGYAILPMIFQDIQTFGLMTAQDFSNLVALSQVTPGPIAINAATYVGYRVCGLQGALIATTGVVLPSFILCILVTLVLDKFQTNRYVQSVLRGIRPATVGLMSSAFLFMFQTALWPSWTDDLSFLTNISEVDIVAAVIFIVIFVLICTRRLSAISLTLFGGFLGIVLSLLFRLRGN